MGKVNWLDKVKEDAERITLKRIRDYKEANSLAEPTKEVEAEVVEEPVAEEVEETLEATEEVVKPKKAKARKAK